MKILITGGHLAPAISVIEALPKETEILYVGRKYGLEADRAISLEYTTITNLGIPFIAITTGRLQRKFTLSTFSSLLKIPVGFFQAFKIIKQSKPDVILSFGGYVAMPICLIGFIFRIPIVIHEQTLEFGLANKIISFFALKICISWESSKRFFSEKKIVFTGNPLRKSILYDQKIDIFKKYHIVNDNLPLVFITGGNLGSHALNTQIEKIIEQLLSFCIVFHQTGDAREYADFERLVALKNSLKPEFQKRYILEKFVDPKDTGNILRLASLIVSRSGMNTVCELLFLNKKAILIPLPFAQNNEQLKNALMLKKIGLAEVLSQNNLTSDKLLLEIKSLMKEKMDKKLYNQERKEIFQQQIIHAADKIVEVIENVYVKKKNKK